MRMTDLETILNAKAMATMRPWIVLVVFAVFIQTATVMAVCTGDPCPLTTQCRSEFGFCDVGPDFCNERSTWNTTGCNNINDNGCPGAACANSTDCRSQFGFCGSTTDFCNAQSTFRPTGCPGFTKSPTTAAPTTKAPTTKSPTTPGATNKPTLAPTTAAPTTASPTSRGFTFAPTLSPTFFSNNSTGAQNNADGNNNSNSATMVAAGVGGGVGALAVAALAFVHYRRKEEKRRQDLSGEVWTWDEEKALKDMFQRTHDFEELCKVVPQRSRESVAIRTRMLLEGERRSTFMRSLMLTPKDRYLFIAERTRKWVPPLVSYKFVVRKPSIVTSFRSFNNSKVPAPAGILTPSMIHANKKGGKTPSRIISENPMYFTDY